nr:UTP--glucose-1-phosphate uridylyltransferase [uncultured Carboxylicivirga sp.]
MGQLLSIICSEKPEIKNLSLDSVCNQLSLEELLLECADLEQFRINNTNLYHKVRALFFLYAIHRFHIPQRQQIDQRAILPYTAYEHILNRRFEEAIAIILSIQELEGPNEGLSSALADAYHKLAFQTLADQVKKSVKTTVGNNWMFRIGHPEDHPLKLHKKLLQVDEETGMYPILQEKTAVRMDLSHSCWSDIFFLGMDYPEGAKVLNISVDLCIANEEKQPQPPIETYFRVINEPIIRLVSTDLEASAEIHNISEIFDFAKDYLGLLKAAIIASGLVPPAMEGINSPVSTLLDRVVGPGLGLELASKVNNIPKGSRLAVSTNLLASLISLCMKATQQTENLTGSLEESERRLTAAKAILGEWIGGSGGGWQDSGGVWPGIKIIEGAPANENDPEFGVSKGKLLPNHTVLHENIVSKETRQKLQDSLVMVHGGMAQDVGPILEMVTEKYLLRSEKEWQARSEALELFDQIVDKLKTGNIQELARLTHQNFDGPIQAIIPWATTAYTEKLIAKTQAHYGDDFWGFWMMGGMSGGGMGFIFHPDKKKEAQEWLQATLLETKYELEDAVPFAMNPVVYDFKINEKGTYSYLLTGSKALLPENYYTIVLPALLKQEISTLPKYRRKELEALSKSSKKNISYSNLISGLFERMLPSSKQEQQQQKTLTELLNSIGFNPDLHEQIKDSLKSGSIGLAKNRLRPDVNITDTKATNLSDIEKDQRETILSLGENALKNGELAIVSMAGGIGSRWTKGAGVVKSLHPFVKFNQTHRNFLEIHLAKNKQVAQQHKHVLPHVFTTSYLTHQALQKYLDKNQPGDHVYLSVGQFIGLRLYPMERDLRFHWEETVQQVLDDQAQKMKESLQNALINWTKSNGEGEDYTDNIPSQCIHPVGHWFEIPNLILNGTLSTLLKKHPNLKYLLLHNIDTLGANADPLLLGNHIFNKSAFSVEVISRWVHDRGGGLANINEKDQLIEGLSLPNEEVEFNLSYYNTGTFWISIDQLLSAFDLTRDDLEDTTKVRTQIMDLAQHMPTYITLKEVKKRWGKGQEDIYPVTQFEKLWGDMTSLNKLHTQFIHVSRQRGQQLKDVAQLDAWLRDGSADYINQLCDWE